MFHLQTVIKQLGEQDVTYVNVWKLYKKKEHCQERI